MNGVRVSNIPNQLSERLLKKYFTDPQNGGGVIKEVIYPLINNDAVIIFEDGLTVVTALTKENPKNSSFRLSPLPHEVFSRVECQLEPGLSNFVMATEDYMKMFRQWGLEVVTKTVASTKVCSLCGTWYRIEWAWNYLGQIMEKQAAIQQRQESRSQHEDSDVSTEVSDLEESRMTNGGVRSSENGAVASSSGSQARSSKLNGAITKEKLYKRERQERYREEEYDTDPGYMRTSDDDSDVGVISQQSGASRQSREATLHGSSRQSRDGRLHESNTNNSTSFLQSSNRQQGSSRQSREGTGFLQSSNMAATSLTSSVGEETVGASGRVSRARDADCTFDHFTSLHGQSVEVGQGHGRGEGQEGSGGGEGQERRGQGQSSGRDWDEDQGQRSPERPSSARSLHQASGGATYRVDGVRSDRGSARGSDNLNDDLSDTDTLQGRSVTSSHSNTPRNASRSLDDPSTSYSRRDHTSSRYSRLYGTEDEVPDGYASQSVNIGDLRVKVYLCDITKATAEAIVNCANSELMHTSGVARAIARSAGERMGRECAQYIRDHEFLETTAVMHTSSGGQLERFKYILHTVGPIYIGSSNRDKCLFDLTKTFLNCLWYADDRLGLNTLALPFISTGVYSIPLEDCVASFIDAVLIFLKKKQGSILKEIHLVNNDINVVSMAITLLQSVIDDADLEQMSKEAVAKYDLKSTPKDVFSGLHSGARPKLTGSGNLRRTNSVEMLSHGRPDHREGSASVIMTSSYAGTLDRRHGFTDTGSSASRYRQRSGSFTLRDKTSSDKDLRRPNSPKTSSSTDFTTSRIAAHKSKPSSKTFSATGDTSIQTSFKRKQSEARSTARSSKSPMKALGPSGREGGAVGHQSSTTIDKLNRSFDRMSLSQDLAPYQSLPADIHKRSSHQEDNCSICLDEITDPKTLEKCRHTFCENCIRHSLNHKPVCPICGEVYGTLIGNQPKGGTMIHKIIVSHKLEGYRQSNGVLEITYSFDNGVQDESHPNPGRPYPGIRRRAFLPNNQEGQEVLQLLYKAFDARLVFTIGDSHTTGEKGVIVWNDIHHKTSMTGGPTQYGYPDASYLSRVKDELAAKGITK